MTVPVQIWVIWSPFFPNNPRHSGVACGLRGLVPAFQGEACDWHAEPGEKRGLSANRERQGAQRQAHHGFLGSGLGGFVSSGAFCYPPKSIPGPLRKLTAQPRRILELESLQQRLFCPAESILAQKAMV